MDKNNFNKKRMNIKQTKEDTLYIVGWLIIFPIILIVSLIYKLFSWKYDIKIGGGD